MMTTETVPVAQRRQSVGGGRPAETRREIKTVKKTLTFKKSVFDGVVDVALNEQIPVAEVVDRALEHELNRVPVLGTIVCGQPTDIENEPEEYVNIGNSLRVKTGDYFLRARGDSMTGDGIQSGDLVLIHPQKTCDSGQIAAVLIESPVGWQSTLKRVHYEPGSTLVCLRSMNPAQRDIEIDTTKTKVEICGVFKGLIRQDG